MKLSDFDFELPDGLIATRPARPRSAARLLVSEGGGIADRIVADLPEILRAGDLLVLNDTRVIPARLTGTRARETAGGEVQARIEVTLLEPGADGCWLALAKPLRKLRAGEMIRFGEALSAEVMAVAAGGLSLRFDAEGDAFDAALAQVGAMPLPPYIAALRPPDAQDDEDYQTVWAARRGAVAAPTASLHFDAELLDALRARGVEFVHVTLHVGAGTFLPVKVEDVATHRMHAEWGEVTPEAAARIRAARAEGRRVIPVGTTALRLIESAADPAVNPAAHRAGMDAGAGAGTDGIAAFAGTTDIFIYPGFRFRVASGLMTNFHLPKSTLMMLVSALMGPDRIRVIYDHAIGRGYRFFSYGDASLLIP